MNNQVFAARLKTLRVQKGLSKADVARALGLSATAYWFYEIGRYRPSKTEVYENLAGILGCDVSYLTYDDEGFSGMEEINAENIDAGDIKDWAGLTLGQRLKKLREEKQLTRNELADLAGIGRSSYEKYERDNNLPVQGEIYDRLAKALGCEAAYLKEGSEAAFKALHSSKLELGRRLRSAREKTGMGLKEFADKIGIPSTTLSNYETGSSKPSNIKLYDSLADALGVDASIFKELDPRCGNGAGSRRNITPQLPKWETVSGVYADAGDPDIAVKGKHPEEDFSERLFPVNERNGYSDRENQSRFDNADSISKAGSDDGKHRKSVQSIVEHFREIAESAQDDSYGASSETIRLVSRLSVLLAGKKLSLSDKSSILLALLNAYQEGMSL